MPRFSFAGLLPGARATKAQAADPAAMDDEEVDPAAMDGEEGPDAEPVAAEGEDDPEAMDSEDEPEADAAKAAYAVGVKAGRKAERARCAAIFASATPATAALAAELAFNTVMPASAAMAVIGVAPAGQGRLAAAMAGRDPKPAAAARDAGDTPASQAARILANAGRVKEPR